MCVYSQFQVLAFITNCLKTSKTWQYLIFVLGFTIIVGIGWEYFEFAVDQIFEDKFGWNRMTLRDTLGDLLYDGLGATIFWVVYKDRI